MQFMFEGSKDLDRFRRKGVVVEISAGWIGRRTDFGVVLQAGLRGALFGMFETR